LKQLFIVGNDADIQHSIIGTVLFKCDPGEIKVNEICKKRVTLEQDTTTKSTTTTTSTSSLSTTSNSSAMIIGPLDFKLVFIVIFAQAIVSLHV